ncbi:MAG: ribosome maturation factor RimP [Clostridia bacterium]|nr:ribosome maturation factor RimP [Clostridia bacterium]
MAKKDVSKKNVAERVRELVEETVTGLGFDLWDVEYKKEGSEYNLVITLDRDDREITLEDCSEVTYAINPILDEADPIQDSYCLEVSSAGLERDLTCDKHLDKYLGQEVEVRLFAPHEELGKSFILPLKAYTPDSLIFERDGELSLERSKIASVKTVVDYDKLFSEQ